MSSQSALSGKEIRLLRLTPGKWEDDIICDFLPGDLDAPYRFEALSYAWGDTNDLVSIVVSGRPKAITRNLEEALRQLRDSIYARVLWVDAICINQEDNEEKTRQVRMMRQIYSSASLVIIWLGPANDMTDGCVNMINCFAQDPQLHWDPARNNKDRQVKWDKLSLLLFLRQSWWRRVWTVQELLVAREAVYQCGRFMISADNMLKTFRSFQAHTAPEGCCIPDDVDRNTMPPHTMVIADLVSRSKDIVSMEDYRKRGRCDFLEIASTFRSRSASDARDKIYALLGLTLDVDERLIDYALDVSTVYENLARGLVMTSKNLDVLGHVACPYRRSGNYEDLPRPMLPSWVPDWNACQDSPLYLMHLGLKSTFKSLFDSCGGTPAKISLAKLPGALEVSGVFCDTVKEMGIPSRAEFPVTEDLMDKWDTLAGIPESSSRQYILGGLELDAYWRCLCFDSTFSPSGNRRMTSKLDYLAYRKRMRWQPGSPKPGPQTSWERYYTMTTVTMVATSKFFISEKRYFGMVPPHAKAGDQIWVLAGGKLPFILRPINKSAIPGQDVVSEYSLVGDAYVHGLMDGEMFSSKSDFVDITLK